MAPFLQWSRSDPGPGAVSARLALQVVAPIGDHAPGRPVNTGQGGWQLSPYPAVTWRASDRWEGPPASAVIDTIMRPDLQAGANEAGIRYVSAGAMAGSTIPLPSSGLRGSRLEIMGSGTGNFPPQATIAAFIATIFEHAAAGQLPLDVVKYDIARVEDALAAWSNPDERPVLMMT